MNSCGVQQARDEMKRISSSSSVVVSSVPDRRNVVVCPKPRRVARSPRWQSNEICDSNSASEILDLILAKSGGGGGGGEQDRARTVTTTPLFFSGSPPSRVSNPITKDSLFREELLMMAPTPTPPRATKPQPPPSPRNGGGGCVTNFGNNPAVRVVGFNCGLDRDRRSSVPTLA